MCGLTCSYNPDLVRDRSLPPSTAFKSRLQSVVADLEAHVPNLANVKLLMCSY